MTQHFSFDVKTNAESVESLFAECVYEDGFVGYNEEDEKVTLFYNCHETTERVFAKLQKNYELSEICSIEHKDYNEEWKQTIKPVKIADEIWVSPKWLEPELGEDEKWIKIEPQMAFGTGHHETTRLASKLIFSHPKANSLLDIGTGSGILAFVAQIVGYKSIIGVEIDNDCRDNLAQNLADNKGRADIRFFIGGIEKVNPSARFDAVVMNMIRSESVPLLLPVSKMLSSGGILFWSGILLEEKDRVIAEAKKFGFELLEEISENEWWGGKLMLKR